MLASCGASLAQWQWLDKDGRKVFSDRPPPADVPDKKILKRPSGAAPTAAANEARPETQVSATSAKPSAPLSGQAVAGGVDKELEAKAKQAAQAEDAKRKASEQAIMKARIESCARAKQSLATLDSGVRVARTNAAGEQEVLDDAGRAAERRHIQGVISSDCR